MSGQGVIILDADRIIQVLTSGAEDLLGWRADHVVGLSCSVVLDCRDAEGHSLCSRCPSVSALARQEMTEPALMEMADPSGERRRMSTSFWYLPPAGYIYQPRIMAVMQAATDAPLPRDRSMQSAKSACA